MGNVISRIYDAIDNFYEKYYPKQSRWFRPVYVSSLGMVSTLAVNAYFNQKGNSSTFNNFLFLTCTGANLGVQLWVSFVSGLTMIKLLPRHQFGLVQSHLFPKYFFLSTFFSFGSLLAFLNVNPVNTWKNESMALGCLLASSFVLNVSNFSCFNIHTIRYNMDMHRIEKSAGAGLTTIGKLIQESKVESNQEYLRVRSKFNLFHGFSLGTNLLSVFSTIGQFYLLSSSGLFRF